MRVDGPLANGGHTCLRKYHLRPPEHYTSGFSHGSAVKGYNALKHNGKNW